MSDFTRRLVAPSILAADWSHLIHEIKRAEDAGADWLHLDVMDGHFVDNISFGPQMVAAVRKSTDLFLDVHLMIHRADHYLERFIKAGANNITIHLEAQYDTSLRETLQRIRQAGVKVGLAINPATPLEGCLPYLSEIDLLLVMTVVPGFGGQPFITDTLSKIEAAAAYRETHSLAYHIEVDGGIYEDTAQIAAKSGANVFVAGTYAFAAEDMRQNLEAIRA